MGIRIRDAVTGDIILDKWEELSVRTPTFQRLHRIKQLGNAFHVYPSAMHTRFEHSLGVCYQIKKLFSHPGFFKLAPKPSKDERRLIPLAGLLHDIVHTPFRHTLERDTGILPEGNLADEYRYRIEKIKSEQVELRRVFNNERIEFLIKVLSTKHAYSLDKPYFRQIIEDTLSADLLDYSRRDAYFTTGVMRQWDERIYDHIAVALYAGKPCLVAKIIDEEGKIAESAITELTNLLYIRYVLNERVYFYPTKIAADSLLVKSLRCFLMSSNMPPEQFKDIYKDMSDEELVNFLAESDVREASFYANCLKNRELPKLAHDFKPNDLASYQKDKIAQYCRGFACLDKWLEYETKIAQKAGIGSHNIIIYCHDLDMQKKKPDFLIKDEQSECRPLQSHERMMAETKAIREKHENLWRCYVFSLDKSKECQKKVEIAAKEVLSDLQ